MVNQQFLNNFKIFCIIVFTICITLILLCPTGSPLASGKMYHPSNDSKKIYGSPKTYTKQQQITRGTTEPPKYTVCRLKKRVVTKGGEVCIYVGGNKTHEMVVEMKCPRSFKCIYNPNTPEPNINDVVDSLNKVGK
jgi:hypothetical protein